LRISNLNSIVGTIQEGRAQNTLAALRNFVQTKALVRREGIEIIIPDTNLVPGDVVILREGDKILFGKYERTGNINKPVVLMHTIYDQLIPPAYGVSNFENMVRQQAKDQYFTVKYTNGQAHCSFTPKQTAIAFDELRDWVKTGKKAKAGFVE